MVCSQLQCLSDRALWRSSSRGTRMWRQPRRSMWRSSPTLSLQQLEVAVGSKVVLICSAVCSFSPRSLGLCSWAALGRITPRLWFWAQLGGGSLDFVGIIHIAVVSWSHGGPRWSPFCGGAECWLWAAGWALPTRSQLSEGQSRFLVMVSKG